MADTYRGELQDNAGNTLYPHTESEVVFTPDGKNVQEKLVSLENAVGGVTGKSSSLEISDPKILATTEATNKLHKRFGGITEFVVDPGTGKITGYKTEKGGADAVLPFSGGGLTIPAWQALLNGQFVYLIFDTKNFSKISIGHNHNASVATVTLEWSDTGYVPSVNGVDSATWNKIATVPNGAGLDETDISAYDHVRIYVAGGVFTAFNITNIVLS